MRRLLMALLFLLAFFGETIVLAKQTSASQASQSGATRSAITPTYAYGEVVEIKAGEHSILIRTKDGQVTALVDPKTTYLRIKPGAQNLEGAERISMTDIGVGDVVMARGRLSDDKKTVSAHQVVVMAKAEIARSHERSREEWRNRGISGRVTAVSKDTKEVKVTTTSAAGERILTLAVTENVMLRRYAQDSVRYSDSRQATLEEIKVGDQLRAIGEMSADGLKFTPEVVVFGAFRLVGGAITSVDVDKREITINDIPSKKPVKILLNDKSAVRRIPADLVNALKQRSAQNSSAAARPASAAPDPPAKPANVDIIEVFEQLPPVNIKDLKPGSMILVASSISDDPSRVIGIMLATGLDSLFTQPAQQRRTELVGAVGLPRGVFDSLIGVQ